MKTDLYNQQAEKIGTMELPPSVFGVDWKPALVHQAIVAFLANRRAPVAHTKDRSEVSGGGKKPWRQKHTGRSRHGSSRSPLWRHGGITFGPRNERIFAQKINKKMKQIALHSVLSKKIKDGEIYIIDTLRIEKGKTKQAAAMLNAFFGKQKKKSVLMLTAKSAPETARAGRNIQGVTIAPASSLNIYDCAAHKYLLIEKEAAQKLETRI